ncbi:MAG: SCO family protein [Bacteroidota bacterium]|nr:SCO family protein [Bacteroidota bacterium]
MNRTLSRLTLILIIVLPIVLYYIMRQATIVVNYVPILGEKEYDPIKKDTIYHKVPAFKFTDQLGRTITEKKLDGHVYIANFFFSTCKDVCPKMQGVVRSIYEKFCDTSGGLNKDPFVRFISHTVDPETDTVAQLKKYADAMGANPDFWYFVTGSKPEIYGLAQRGYLLPTGEDPSIPADSMKFFHSQILVLVDKEKRIRGAYDSHDPNDINRLQDDVRMLVYEYNEKLEKAKK